MNQREIEKEIWASLLVVVENLEDFDPSLYEQLEFEGRKFDKALDRVAELLAKKVK